MMWPSANVSLLIFLYFIQGLPYGFQTRFLPIHLHAQGISLTDVGLLRLVQLPWLLKALWAPFIDCYSTKRKWLLFSIIGLLLTCIIASLLSIDPYHLVLLLFLLNIFSVTHDIVVDSIAIGILHNERDLGLGNTAQVVGYKIGSVFGGGLLMLLVDFFDWSGMCIAVAVLYGEALMFVYLSPILRDHEQKQQVTSIDSSVQFADADEEGTSNDNSHHDNDDINCSELWPDGSVSGGYSYHVMHNGPSQCYCQKFSHKNNDLPVDFNKTQPLLVKFARHCYNLIQVSGTSWVIAYVISYKLGEQGVLNLLPLYLIDHGMSSSDMIFWTSVFGQTISILGSMLGGALMARLRLPIHILLQQLCLLRLMPTGGILLLLVIWEMQIFSELTMRACSLLLMSTLLLLSGAMTSATFTMMMKCSRQAVPWLQGTHYALLSTAETLGKVIFVSVAGAIVDTLGYQATFLGFLLLTFASVQLIRYCPISLVEEFMSADASDSDNEDTVLGDHDSEPDEHSYMPDQDNNMDKQDQCVLLGDRFEDAEEDLSIYPLDLKKNQ